MSEFLMVVPAGWIEIQAIQDILNQASVESIQQYITDQIWWEIEQMLENIGVMPVDQSIVNARIFDDGSGYKLWVQFGDLR